MKTIFVHPNGSTMSLHNPEIPKDLQREYYLQYFVKTRGEVWALLTKDTTYVARDQKDLDNYIDQRIEDYLDNEFLRALRKLWRELTKTEDREFNILDSRS